MRRIEDDDRRLAGGRMAGHDVAAKADVSAPLDAQALAQT
jgi:hypothetical protein